MWSCRACQHMMDHRQRGEKEQSNLSKKWHLRSSMAYLVPVCSTPSVIVSTVFLVYKSIHYLCPPAASGFADFINFDYSNLDKI